MKRYLPAALALAAAVLLAACAGENAGNPQESADLPEETGEHIVITNPPEEEEPDTASETGEVHDYATLDGYLYFYNLTPADIIPEGAKDAHVETEVGQIQFDGTDCDFDAWREQIQTAMLKVSADGVIGGEENTIHTMIGEEKIWFVFGSEESTFYIQITK